MAQAKRIGGATSVASYLAKVPAPQRAALQALRRQIRAAAPDAEEVISYQIPAYKQGGLLVGFSAASTHLTFQVMSPALLKDLADDLKGYKLGRGSIQFTPERPLPARLVTRLVKRRLQENEARA